MIPAKAAYKMSRPAVLHRWVSLMQMPIWKKKATFY